MHSPTIPIASGSTTRSKTWPQKLRREAARLLRQANTLAMRPVALSARNQFLFLLGHMRSGSSLLCHLLCASPDIIGFGEAHHSYRRRSDLARLLTSVRRYTGRNPLEFRYVMDKVVGCQHAMGPGVLADRRTRYVFLVRDPAATIASLVAMRRQYHDETSQQLIAFASEHYRERLAQLVQLARTIDDPARCLLLTHRQVLAETSLAFGALEEFLALSKPLEEEYDLMPTTGQPGIGDPSPNIRLGKIERSLPRKHVELPAALRADLEQCYDNCVESVGQVAQTTGSQSLAHSRRAA